MSSMPLPAVAPTVSVERTHSSGLRRFVLHAFLVIVGFLILAPLIWMFATSFTHRLNAFRLPPTWIPIPGTFQNFLEINDTIPFLQMILNSAIITLIATLGALLTSLMAGYAFSRLTFQGRDAMFAILLAALMVPAQLTVIPLFILMRNLGLIDTLASVWLPACVNVFGIFFLRQYFKSIPMELSEAAVIDGAGHLRILFQIMVPLARPALAALTILLFEATWNNYFWASVFLRSPETMTWPLGLVQLQGFEGGGPAVVVFAAITTVIAPGLILFVLFQRSFVASIATTGVKG